MTTSPVAPVSSLAGRAVSRLNATARAYEPSGDRPLGGYLAVLGTYATLTGVAALLVRGRRGRLPERIPAADLALLAVATHKVSRVLAKDPVMSPFRAPVTEFSGQSGAAEVAERPRRSGVLHAVGELVTCPYCLAQWVGTGMMTGLLVAPRLTRLVASTMTVVAAADFIHITYQAAEKRA